MIDEPIDFKSIPVSVKLHIAKKKIIAMQATIDWHEEKIKERVKEVIELKDENKSFMNDYIKLSREKNGLEKKLKEIEELHKLTNGEKKEFKKLIFYREAVALLEALRKKDVAKEREIKSLRNTNNKYVCQIVDLKNKLKS